MKELKTSIKNTQLKFTNSNECCANCEHMKSYAYPDHYGYCKLVPNVKIHFQDTGSLICKDKYISKYKEYEAYEEMSIEEFMEENILDRYNNPEYWEDELYKEYNNSDKIYKIVEVADNFKAKITPEIIYAKWRYIDWEKIDTEILKNRLKEKDALNKPELIKLIESTFTKEI